MTAYHLEPQYPAGEAGAPSGPYWPRDLRPNWPRDLPPTLIVLHSTRSGIAGHPDDQELRSTLNWFHRGVAGAHAVVSELGNIYWIVPLDWRAWGATYLNRWTLHIEMTQPTADTPYTEGHYQGCAQAIRVMVEAYPNIPLAHVGTEVETGIIGHEETRQGRLAGKSDPGGMWDWGKLMGMLEDDMDTAEIERALGVIWGYAEVLEKPPGMTWRRARQRQAAKELKDAVAAIKQEAGIN